jgi:flavin-dependent dehydrogenase
MTNPGGDEAIPKTCEVLIIGGGPAGSSAAAMLARAGVDCVLLEKLRHPRPAVGESLIPHFWKYADCTGASPVIEQEGFIAKAGGITVWNGHIHRIAFAEFGFTRPALHVERDRFDELLLRHSADQGARVFQEVAVKRVDFADAQAPRVHYQNRRAEGRSDGAIACRYVIDASGPGAVLARQFGSRRLIDSRMRFLSLWGYFENSRFVGADGRSHAQEELGPVRPVTFVTSFADGWIWHIPLRRTTSVGLVINTDQAGGMSKAERERFFLDTCRTTPYLDALLANARYREGSLEERPDYSYYSSRLCGENYYLIGDAGSFVDPIYSHGVLNAFYNAVMVATAIGESLRDASLRARHAQLCEHRMRQFYGFSRSLALGEFGGDGVDTQLVTNFMRSVPSRELELMLAAAHMSERSSNFHRLIENAGLGQIGTGLKQRSHFLERLDL